MGVSMRGYMIKTIKELGYYRGRILCFSVVIILFLMYGANMQKDDYDQESKSPFSIGVIDLDQSLYSKLLIKYFETSEEFIQFAKIVSGNQNSIEEKFKKGQLTAYLEIPQDFADNLMYLKNTPIKAVVNNTDTTLSILIRNVLDSYETYISAVQINSVALFDVLKQENYSKEELEKMNYESSIKLIMTALGRNSLFEGEVHTQEPYTDIIEYYIWAFLVLAVCISSIICGNRLIQEVSSGVFYRIRIIGHSAYSLIHQIIFVNTVVSSVLICSILWLMNRLLSYSIPIECYFFYFLCCYGLSVFSCILAGICKEQRVYIIISNLFLLIGTVFGGVAVPLIILPKQYLTISKCFANYWMLQYSLQYKEGIRPIGITVMAIMIFAIGVVGTFLVYELFTNEKARRREYHNEIS